MTNCVKGKNMIYEMVQHLSWLNGWIKKSTFWVSLVRVFGLTLAKTGEIDFRFLHHHLIGVNYVTFNLFPTFGFKNHSFHPFLCFKALFWRVNQGRTKISIDRGVGPREALRSRDGARHVTLPCGPRQVQSKTKPNGTGVKTLTFNPALPHPIAIYP